MASPGFVASRSKAIGLNKGMGHSQRTSGPGAAAARWLIVLWLMQYWWKELWVVDICISWCWSRWLHNSLQVVKEMLIGHVLPLSCYRKKLLNVFHGFPPKPFPPNLPDLNPSDAACGSIAREGVQNTHHWSGRTEVWNSDWQRSGPSWIMSSLP